MAKPDSVAGNDIRPQKTDFFQVFSGAHSLLSDTVLNLFVGFGQVNVDENPGVAQTYGIRSIPTLILFKKGQVACRIVGVRPQVEIEKEIETAIK